MKWAALSAAVLAVIAVVVAIVFSVRGGDASAPSVADGDGTSQDKPAAGSGAPTASSPAVDLKGLEAIPPPAAEFLTTLGLPPTVQVRRGDSPIDGDYVADDFKCRSVVNPFDAAGYRGSGYTSMRFSKVRDPDATDVTAVQAVWAGGVLFQTADAAKAMFDKLKATLQTCAGKTVNLKTAGENESDSFWNVGTPTTDGAGVVSLVNAPEGGGEWRCAHAAAVRNNVIVEVVDCKDGQTVDRAVTLVNQMTAKSAAP